MRVLPILFLLFLVVPAHCAAFTASEVTTCVSPDSSLEVLEQVIDGTSSTLLINVYTLTSHKVAQDIVDARGRGVEITFLLEESPVGGISKDEKVLINMLRDAGVQVYLSRDDSWRYNHGKYAVSDDRTVFISTENFGYGGFPAEGISGNRGWCAAIEGQELAGYFSALYVSDLANARKVDTSYSTGGASSGPYYTSYDADFDPKTYEGAFKAVPIVAPVDALEGIIALLDSANRSIYAEEFYAYTYWGEKTDSPETAPNLFLAALIDAARRGCEVRLLLDDTWYNVERDDPRSNYYTVKYLNDIAEREGLDLEVRLFDSEEAGIEKLHAKGVVVDGSAALISSVNWNEHSPTNNREVGVIIYGEPAQYYAKVFEKDWSGQTKDEPPILLLVGVVSLVPVVYLLRKVRV